MPAKERADKLLVDRGLAPTRARGQAMILAGQVYSGTKRIEKAGDLLAGDADLNVKGADHPWVSRGGLKLVQGLDHFGLDPRGRIAIDVGASTGGFTDVLLTRGAEKVYAVDVGHGQLAWKLRNDPRVVVLERTNARYLDRALIPEPLNIVVCDASFIGLETVLPAALALAAPEAWAVALIKPQFEVGPDRVGKGGVVRDPALHQEVCDRISAWFGGQAGWTVLGITESPIQGPEGNREFLIAARRDAMTPNLPDTIEIQSLGAQGDGVAMVDDARIFVPFALPGDRVRCEIVGRRSDGWTATLTEIVAAGPQRTSAAGAPFAHCGGCMLQHLEHGAYRAWKLALVETALRQRGLEMPAGAALIDTPPNSRRRARFAVERTNEGLRFGFHMPESTKIAPDADCRILSSRLAETLPLLRDLAAAALGVGGTASVTATLTETGLDVLITTEKPLERRRALTEVAVKAPIARLSWQRGRGEPEPLLQQVAPRVHFGGIGVDLPPEAFLQPSAEGEAALVAAVLAYAKGAKSIADLYAGCGTFTFPLAKIGKVAAYESAKPAVAAIIAAANRSGLAGRVTAKPRNLDASPLPPEDLKAFDCVVFDPPRAGARTQAEMLVRSRIKHVVAVSCNPASFARDARILVDGGFALKELVAVDQFVWSAHVEVVALFRR